MKLGEIFDRLKDAKGFRTDSDLAAYLGMTRQSIAAARMRDSMDFRRLVEACDGLDLNWILLGRQGADAEAIASKLEDLARSLRGREGQH